ncbi:hypothetical protein LTR37_001263 [Vermiconidia calcicola]|uniref:Uncharacterized protein n=1 Tax=Vermiconidia calcicola TaxID=1690605 RepID=A0ACC3NWE6_9PEZI|nr:hypothetical protein LTR37_001263 [Vermiconidia calcicola]
MAGSTVIDIDRDGDVIIAWQSDGGECILPNKLRVNSAVLARGSPVFKAMLSERFKEGSELTANGAVEIPLSVDEAEGMTVMCDVLHFRNDQVPEILAPPLLEDIAKLVDKYDCVEAMRHAARTWLQTLLLDQESKGQPPSPKILTAAYYFQDARMINESSEKLVKFANHDLKDANSDHPHDLEKLQDALQQQREKIFLETTRFIDSEINILATNACSHGKGCQVAAKFTCGVLQKLSNMRILTNEQRRSHRPAILIKTVEEFDGGQPQNCAQGTGCLRNGAEWTMRSRFQEKAKSLRGLVKAPCLACIREGSSHSGAPCKHAKVR